MNRRRQRRSNSVLFVSILVATLAVGLSVFALADDSPEIADSASAASVTAPDGFPQFTLAVPITQIADTQYLKLVNRDRPLARPIDGTQLVTVWPDIPARANYETLHETAFAAMLELFASAKNANMNNLFLASGFRGYEEQSYLYANAIDRRYVMPPGHSEHQLGLAADILLLDFRDMQGSPEARWLAENAPTFGLILRYPADKEDITGVAYEPWHFRYVGRVHAWYMARRAFVLEEYIEYLQANGGYRAEFAGRTYYVLYQRPENGMILVPEGLDFWVSSANTGGYVVTAWR